MIKGVVSVDFFGRLKEAIISPSSYKVLARGHAGASILYLLLVVFLVTLPVHIYRAMQMIDDTDEIVATLKEEMPPFVLADGELKVDGQMPVVFEESDMIIIIDTRGEMDESDLHGHNQGIFIGQDRIVQKDGLTNQSMYFRDLGDVRFTKADLLELIPYLNIFAVSFVIFGSLAVFGFKLLQALLLSVLVLLLAKNARVKLDYAGCFNIAVYALTLPILLDGIVMAFWPAFPMFFLVYYTIACAYIVLGLRSCQEA